MGEHLVQRRASFSSPDYSAEPTSHLTLEEIDLADVRYSPTGHILFTRGPDNRGLWAVPFSLSGLEVTGAPFLVVPQGSQASASSDGTLVYTDSRARSDVELVWFDAEGEILGTIGQRRAGGLAVSPPEPRGPRRPPADDDRSSAPIASRSGSRSAAP